MADEKRLIYANDLWSDIMMLPHNGDIISSDDVEQAIMEAPTIDAVPVVHGEWTVIEDDILDEAVYKCSVCGEEFVTLDGEHPTEHLWNYCPNCGAKMDGERKDKSEDED